MTQGMECHFWHGFSLFPLLCLSLWPLALGKIQNDASCQQPARNCELRRFSSTSWTFTWLQPWPTSGLEHHEKPCTKTIHLSHFQLIRNRNDEIINVCCFKAMSFGVISYTIIESICIHHVHRPSNYVWKETNCDLRQEAIANKFKNYTNIKDLEDTWPVLN